jgi:hypothetical protein
MVMWRKDCECCHEDAFSISGRAHEYIHGLLERLQSQPVEVGVVECDHLEITSEDERDLESAESALEDALAAIQRVLDR